MRRKRGGQTRVSPALTLALATYQDLNPSELLLTFDRAIDLADFDGAAIVVNDAAITGMRWQGTEDVGQPDDTTVRITLTATGPATPGPLTMSAGANNGIVAVDDGGQWAGVTNVGLPFP